jgi:hypothetical protein
VYEYPALHNLTKEETAMRTVLALSALVLTASLCQRAFAQSEAEALITASVESQLTLVNVDGDWGVFSPGLNYTISASGFKEPPGPGEGAGIVVGPVGFEIDGNAGSQVVITLVLPQQLVSDDGNGGIAVGDWTFGWNYDNDPSASWAASGPVIGNAVPLIIGGGGASGLFLGATLTVPQTAFAGTYTGQVIGSAAYTGN